MAINETPESDYNLYNLSENREQSRWDQLYLALERARNPLVSVVVVPNSEAAALADGDVVTNPTWIPLPGGYSACELRSIQVIDKSDQGTALDIIFYSQPSFLGIANAAASLTDQEAEFICSPAISIATGDYIDTVANRTAGVSGIGLVMPVPLWFAVITRGGTPTYASTGLRYRFGFVMG